MASSRRVALGVPGLDRLIGVVEPPYTLLVAGHPGAGKTTLATAICYANVVEGRRCLYLTFYEDRGKYFRFMKRLGFDLESAESRGLFRFVRLPQTLDVEAVVGEVNRVLAEGFDVVVVDSITALLEPVAGSAERRAWLINYFYQLPTAINGLLILVAELPYGEERLGLSSVEFVADAVVLLKHRIEDGFLTRVIEVRKARGAPIHVAETYFTIAERVGIVVFTPPVLAEIPQEGEEIDLVCSSLKEVVEHYHRGFAINVFYPPEPGTGLEALVGALALALKNGMRLLVVSYTHPITVLRAVIKDRLARYGISGEKVDRALDRYAVITALNPFAHSVTQLTARELTIIEQVKPDLVVFYGVHLPRVIAPTHLHFKELFNELMYLKFRGITVVRVGVCFDKTECDREISLSDVTYRFERSLGGRGEGVEAYVYRRFGTFARLSGNVVGECEKEWAKTIEELLSGS